LLRAWLIGWECPDAMERAFAAQPHRPTKNEDGPSHRATMMTGAKFAERGKRSTLGNDWRLSPLAANSYDGHHANAVF
jgi:hypothetical protein